MTFIRLHSIIRRPPVMYAGSVSTKVDLNKEYLPSLNTPRFDDSPNKTERIFENFLEISTKETQRISEKYNHKKDISYGDRIDNQLLDIYYKDQEHGTKIFAYIHGGYWQLLDKSSSGVFVAPFVERGYRVINVDYNLCPNVTLPELFTQIRNFYKWLYKYAWETNAVSIAICGHSAGASLATVMLQEDGLELLSKYPIKTTFILIAGVYDLRELHELESVNPKNALGLTAETAIELSPICWKLTNKSIELFRKHGMQIHLLVGEHESTTFKEHSLALAKMLSDLDSNVFYKCFKNYDHFDIIEQVPNENSAITKYLVEILNA